MKPSEILSGEHRVIEQVLACLERIAQDCETQGRLDRASAEQALDFFRNFADRCHHGKEEAHFFPAMEAKGFSRQSGPTGVMLREHDQGRSYVRGMAEAVAGAAAGDRQAVRGFVQNARDYVALLSEHIRKEDHCLFTMADQAFSAADQRKLLDAFEHVEQAHMGAGTHEKFLHLAGELADRYGVPRAEQGRAAGCGCHGHSLPVHP
jgi:hemerythrin-like domain-containing protein